MRLRELRASLSKETDMDRFCNVPMEAGAVYHCDLIVFP